MDLKIKNELPQPKTTKNTKYSKSNELKAAQTSYMIHI